jgi:aminomethyltransferase
MPVQYSGIRAEHLAVREAAGLFDVSHMGEFHMRGGYCLKWLNTMIANDLRRIAPGKAQYTQICNDAGVTVDDLIVYWLDQDHFLLVVNAGNIDKDWRWFQDHCPPQVTTPRIGGVPPTPYIRVTWREAA